MSSSTPETSNPPPDFKSILDTALSQALGDYKKKTGKDLLEHPLANKVQRCDSVDAIKAIFQGQAEAFQQFKDGDQRLMKWINPVVDVLFTFSKTAGGVAGTTIPHAKAIFTGISVLLGAAKDVRTSHKVLVEPFERIEGFFNRLGVYTQVSLTADMAKVFVKIVAEVLSILSIATKEMKRKRSKIYLRKLLGRKDIEDALKRLDNLIQEEVRMATAETMKATIEHKDDSKKVNVAMASNMDEIKWNQIEQDVRKWFSPPDPSTNHNTACEVYHNVPPTWFFGAGVFKDWMSNGSLLWVHGKPGSGKSILCSAIIQHIMTLRDAGRATLAYFYFDFRDEEKQEVRNAVTSLLIQLSAYSKPCCDIIWRLHSARGKGTQQPSTGVLIDRLKEMLKTAVQQPTFIVMDALDECPDEGLPTPRELVLNLVKDLVRLQLPNLHLCVTSRPEVDIQTMLKPLAVNALSLHDETRQKIVIANYVSSVVSSDVHMKKWRDEDKKLVVEELSERADGMFQWVFCQLETLRHVVQPDVRAVLDKLPKTLDETYERVLKDIKENNREHTRRLLHCLTVAVRPLRVEELAETLAFDFDTAQGGIPKFRADRRSKDQEVDVLSLCSSLITIVDNRGSRVVQFSHMSVKEFLTANHLTSSTGHLPSYHILPGPAHAIFAQICLGLLLGVDGHNDNKSIKESPLAEYAARHWVAHAQFEGVSSRVEDGMKSLFDLDKPHFTAWIGLYDIDAGSSGRFPSQTPSPLYYSALCGFHGLVRQLAIKYQQHVNAVGGSFGFPLVAALCRNHSRVAELLLELGGSIDVRDTRKQTPLHKAMDRHDKVSIDAVQFLLEHGADVNAQRDDLWTPLHLAVNIEELSVVRMLLWHQADVNSRNGESQVPLHLISNRKISQDEGDDGSDIAKLLLKNGANVNEKDKDNATPLHLASYNGRTKIVQVLLDHGANADAENNQGVTPLELALRRNHEGQENAGVAQLLLEHGAQVYARDKYHISMSDLACCFGKEKIGPVLLVDGGNFKPEINRDQTVFWLWIEECGVGRNVQDKYDTILLHSASYHGRLEMAQTLITHGVKSNAKNHLGETALHVVSRGRHDLQDGVHVTHLLLKHGVNVNAQDKNLDSPLHFASYTGMLDIVRVLLDHDAQTNGKNDRGETPLHQVSQGEYESQEDGVDVAQLLLDHGADVKDQDKNGVTPIHLASGCGKLEVARLLIKNLNLRVRTSRLGQEERSLDLNVRQKDHETPLHFACFKGKPEIVRLLLDHGAKVNVMNHHGETPLHLVSRGEYDPPDDGVRVAELLLERGTDVNAQDNDDWTPLHSASYSGKPKIMRVLLRHGAKVNAVNHLGETPLHLARQGNIVGSQDGLHVAQLLLDSRVDVNARDKRDWTPLHAASYYGRVEIAQVLLDNGAKIKAEDNQGGTPLHQVAQGNFEYQEAGGHTACLLLERGMDANAQDNNKETPLHVASRCGLFDIARVLLEHIAVKNSQSRTPPHLGFEGFVADVNAIAEKNWTPLHSASYWGRLNIAQLLLDHGAKANAETDSGETPLHSVAKGEYESQEDGVHIAQLLLKHGVDANARCKAHWTPLHVASFSGKFEIVRVLLDNSANANTKGNEGETTLHRVSCGKCQLQNGVRTARLLLEQGAEVNAQSNDLRSPLHVASFNGKLEIARLLLDHGAKMNVVNKLGETPLHMVSRGKFDSEEAGAGVAQLLLKHGGDVNTKSMSQRNPLHVASLNGKPKIVQLLLDYGAKVDVVDALGEMPLHLVSRGNFDSEEAGVGVAQLLLENGSDVNIKGNSQCNPLHVASLNGKPKIAQLLLDNGAKVDAADEVGETPLHYVSRGNHEFHESSVHVAQLLLKHGGKVSRQGRLQRTPLHVASLNGKLDIVRLLLNHGAKVDAVDDKGETPLHYISQGKHDSEKSCVGVAQLLLTRGGGVSRQDKLQRTPLHVASLNGKLGISQLLLDNGAKVDAVDDEGETPLHYVSRGRHDSEESGVGVALLLLERGGDANAQAKTNWTPLHVASYLGKPEIARLLLDRGAKVNAVDGLGNTPLHNTLPYDHGYGSLTQANNPYDPIVSARVARLILERGGDANMQNKKDHGQTLLHYAALSGELEIARLLLDNGAKVNAVDNLGDTALHIILRDRSDSLLAQYPEPPGEHIGFVRLLLERGGDVNTQNKKDRIPLHHAIRSGEFEIARLLLDHGAKVNVTDDFGDTPLHAASRYHCGRTFYEANSQEDHIVFTRLLLERVGDANVPNKKDHARTPLHYATRSGELYIARLLLDNGAKVNAVDNLGDTPLYIIMRDRCDSPLAQCPEPPEEHIGFVRLLLERGSDANIQSKSDRGRTPLHYAALSGDFEIAKLLLDNGAKANTVDNFGDTPLHIILRDRSDSRFSAYPEHPEEYIGFVRLLLERGSDANIKSKRDRGQTPLHYAALSGELEIARLLLDHGAKANAVDDLGDTPLLNILRNREHMFATGPHDNIPFARLLLERGGDANIQSKRDRGRTPLHYAALSGEFYFAQLLLGHGAEVNAVDDLGDTPLHTILRYGDHNDFSRHPFVDNIGFIRLLLEHGANANARTRSGESPLDLVTSQGPMVTQLLLEHGAIVNTQPERPRTNSSWTGFFKSK